ncbi:DUF6268 family outer membrane beta-barrel protein [Zobellia alginiliquefaciens]|uniref:DUF6268 family outer membrane beta-barrel protein n=1 Tax=Zobellia alginiliquefaciens TaxID=3032586 RepID=UPI0023E45F78|nr:DUF6268 family outer membrane beta-barrel protein [Zobellia alginiliquefaciens]
MKKILILLLLIVANNAYAQETDDIYINSEFFPSSDVGSVLKLEAGAAIPVLNTAKEKLAIGASVQNASFDFVDREVPFETDQIEMFNSFGLQFKYQRKLSANWALNVMGESQIASNFDENEIKSDDIFFNAMVTLEKYSEENNSIWTFGAVYDIAYGLYYPIPVIAYTKRINEAWAYKIGVPDSRVKWSLGTNHNFEGFATLTGFTGNINDDIDVYKEDYTGTLRQTSVLLGLGYNVTFLGNFGATVKGGYTAYNRLQIQDYNNNEIYDFNVSNSFYLNVGLKYTFDSKTNIKSIY